MKTEDLLLLAGAAVLGFLFLRARGAGGAIPLASFTTGQNAAAQTQHFFTAIPWVDPMGYGGAGGLNRDYLETDANGVSIIP